MHACGPTPMSRCWWAPRRLLRARRDQLAGKRRFHVQPGEEGYHGARFIAEAGPYDGLSWHRRVRRLSPLQGERAVPGQAWVGERGRGKHGVGAIPSRRLIHGEGATRQRPTTCLDRSPIACAMSRRLQGIRHAPGRRLRSGGDHHSQNRGGPARAIVSPRTHGSAIPFMLLTIRTGVRPHPGERSARAHWVDHLLKGLAGPARSGRQPGRGQSCISEAIQSRQRRQGSPVRSRVAPTASERTRCA